MQPSDVSFATRFLRAHPEVRERIAASDKFRSYRAGLERESDTGKTKTVVIDGNQFFVVGGDMLKDEDELMLDWARTNGLVSEADIQAYQAEEIRRDQDRQDKQDKGHKGGKTQGEAEQP
jgi:hypothetical protein